MGGDGGVLSARQERFGRAQKFAPDRGHVGERELDRFVVGAFAEPDSRAERDRVLDVLRRAAQVRLQDDADVVVAREGPLEDAQGGIGNARPFHVDPHEWIGQRRGARQNLGQVARAHLFVDEQTERGQLERDVRPDCAALDRGEHREIGVARVLRFFGAHDVFAEEIERSAQAFGIERGDRGERRVDALARDEAFCEKEEAALKDRVGCEESVDDGHRELCVRRSVSAAFEGAGRLRP